ncbi:NAD(P)H-dependent oxidoreductase [Oleiharenicola lentus]|uniref:NAD(P)H-dependent oxidoreductase n=1 Tax=Oleiharenicola lentus TaxID=2508720 RepID=UPI003F67F9CE
MNSTLLDSAAETTISGRQLLTQLRWRYATKQFDPTKKISSEDWLALEETLVLTPSSIGLQPWKFLVIDDPKVRAELLLASYGQPQVVDASHFVVLAAKTNYNETDVDAHVRHMAEMRGVPIEALTGLRTMATRTVQGMNDSERHAWAFNQTYIALGNLLTSAALLGIDAAPMEGFERARYDDILGLKKQGLASAVIVGLGYRDSQDKYATAPKVRFPRTRIVQHI